MYLFFINCILKLVKEIKYHTLHIQYYGGYYSEHNMFSIVCFMSTLSVDEQSVWSLM